MFIFTTKFNKKKAVLAVLILAAILIAVILIAGGISRSNAKEAAALSAVVKNNDQRVQYLNSLGWEVDKNPLEEQKVVIPREFSDVYKKYNEIQISQGFDLKKYGGIEANRYTYKVHNYPGATGNVVADLLIYRNEVIAGDVQSNAFDGFMVGLKFPKPAAPSPSAALPTAANPSAAPTGSAPTANNPNAAGSSAKPNAAAPSANNNAAAPSAKPNAPAPSTKPNAAAPNAQTSTATSPNAVKTAALTSDSSASKK